MAPTANSKSYPSVLDFFYVAVYTNQNLALKYICCGVIVAVGNFFK